MRAPPTTWDGTSRRPSVRSRTGGPLLLDLGGFPGEVPQVVKLRPADVAEGGDLHLGDRGRVDREGPLYPNPEAHLAHGEGLAHPGPLSSDHHALEDLHPLAVALDDPDVHLHGVAGPEVRNVLAQRVAVDDLG